MAEVPFRCRCVPGTGMSGVRVSLVNIEITETIVRQAGYGSPRAELPRRGGAGG